MELKGKDLWSYSHKIESISLRKCPHDHQLTDKPYLSAITVTSIFQSFTYKMVAKTSWHRYGTKLCHCHPMYTWHKEQTCNNKNWQQFVCRPTAVIYKLHIRVPQQSWYSIYRPRRDARVSLHFTTCRCTSLCEMTHWSQVPGVFITPSCKCIENNACNKSDTNMWSLRHIQSVAEDMTVYMKGIDNAEHPQVTALLPLCGLCTMSGKAVIWSCSLGDSKGITIKPAQTLLHYLIFGRPA